MDGMFEGTSSLRQHELLDRVIEGGGDANVGTSPPRIYWRVPAHPGHATEIEP